MDLIVLGWVESQDYFKNADASLKLITFHEDIMLVTIVFSTNMKQFLHRHSPIQKFNFPSDQKISTDVSCNSSIS
jgi:hypothetical protein